MLHVREAPADTAAAAVDELHEQLADVPGVHVKAGKSVVEVLARPPARRSRCWRCSATRRAAAVVFVGDDRTDEEVFEALGPGRPSACGSVPATPPPPARLADPPAVLTRSWKPSSRSTHGLRARQRCDGMPADPSRVVADLLELRL